MEPFNVEKEDSGEEITVEGEGAVAPGEVLEMFRHSHVVECEQVDKVALLSVATSPEQSLVALYAFMLTLCCRHVTEMEYGEPAKENGRVQ